jgi:hypothetical protein
MASSEPPPEQYPRIDDAATEITLFLFGLAFYQIVNEETPRDELSMELRSK